MTAAAAAAAAAAAVAVAAAAGNSRLAGILLATLLSLDLSHCTHYTENKEYMLYNKSYKKRQFTKD